jgi:release factor glutamine methyltransferase
MTAGEAVIAPTLASALAQATAALRAAGVEGARRDARLLLGRALDAGSTTIFAYPERRLSPVQAAKFSDLVARRVRREPVSRILGLREFWSLPFALSPDTLDPRPDSETLVEALLARVVERRAPLRLLDLGSGSGCLLLALLSELPGARGLGVDISPGAVGMAKANAAALGLADRAEFRQGDWTEGLSGPFDLVVCNPPYIASGELAALAPEVVLHDPRLALDGGADGLAAYRRILPRLPGLLAPDGWAGFELDPGQDRGLRALLAAAGFATIEAADDLTGRLRCLLVQAGPLAKR